MSKLVFDPTQLSEENKKIYEKMVAEREKLGAPFSGPYLALMNHPKLCEKIEELGRYLKFHGFLSREVYQFVVLAVAHFTQATFEWKDHIQHAIKAGVPASVIQNLQEEGISYKNFPEPYQLAANVLEFTLHWKNIPTDKQDHAIRFYGMQGFIEIVVLSGFYQLFSAINQGFNVN